MPVRRRREIVGILRERIERALASRALVRGDRLPSTREMGVELGADPRVVGAAYRELADEGLVELRQRSGVYVSRQTIDLPGNGVPSPEWLARLLAEGVTRGHSTRDLCDYLRDAAVARKLRAVVIGTTYDQTAGLCRELRADYGFECTGIRIEELGRHAPLPNAVKRANLLVTHDANAPLVKALALRLGKPYIVPAVRPEIVGDEWLLLLERQVFFIATDQRFLELVKEYLAPTHGSERVTMLLAGRDDLSIISPDAPTYVTQAARELLGRTRIPGRLIPPARLFTDECVRQIIDMIVAVNTASLERRS